MLKSFKCFCESILCESTKNAFYFSIDFSKDYDNKLAKKFSSAFNSLGYKEIKVKNKTTSDGLQNLTFFIDDDNSANIKFWNGDDPSESIQATLQKLGAKDLKVQTRHSLVNKFNIKNDDTDTMGIFISKGDILEKDVKTLDKIALQKFSKQEEINNKCEEKRIKETIEF